MVTKLPINDKDTLFSTSNFKAAHDRREEVVAMLRWEVGTPLDIGQNRGNRINIVGTKAISNFLFSSSCILFKT